MANSKMLLFMLIAAFLFSSIAADMEPAQAPMASAPSAAAATAVAGGEDVGAEQGDDATYSSALPAQITDGEFNEYRDHGADKVLIINHVENKNDVTVKCGAGKKSSGWRKHFDALPGDDNTAAGEASGDNKSADNASEVPSRGLTEEKGEGYGDDDRNLVKLINESENKNKVTVKCEADVKNSHKKPYEEEKEEP